jgi:hypothetical protein
MIGYLPKSININGIERAIWSDFRTALLIFQACADPELDEQEQAMAVIECLYQEPDNIPPEDMQEANDKAVWFLEGGGNQNDNSNHQQAKKIMDWEQDEKIIFSAVNKVAGCETRAADYLHWWTFLGYFNEIGEGLFSTVISIRSKRNRGKKPEKYEQEFYRENKALIDIKVRLSAEEQAEIDRWKELLK